MPASIGLELVVLLCATSAPPMPSPPSGEHPTPQAYEQYLEAKAIHRLDCTEITLSMPNQDEPVGSVPQGLSATTVYEKGVKSKTVVYDSKGKPLFIVHFDPAGKETFEPKQEVDITEQSLDFGVAPMGVTFNTCLLAQWPIAKYIKEQNPLFADPKKWRVEEWRCNHLDSDGTSDQDKHPKIGSDESL